MFDHLFSPFRVRGLALKNRVILPAMGTRFCEDRHVTQRLIDYHVARARSGCALNIVEVSSVHTPSAPSMFVSISEDEYVPGHRALVDAIHEAGGTAGVQLWQGSIAVGMDPQAQMLVASDLPLAPGFTLPAVTREQIDEVVACYGEAARRAREAGYDCVEFHCAHNYLPHSFLSGGINHRTDEYGGSLENRARFPLACIRAIREAIGEDMALFMRIDAHDDFLEGGMTIEDTIEFCRWAADAGVDVLDVSRGNIVSAANAYEVPPIDLPPAFNVDNAARIRRETGVPTIGVGRINTPQLAEEILAEDKVDLVVMGRAQLADPDFVAKAREGRVDDIVYCVGCDQGCLDGFADMERFEAITCLRNPQLGHETDWALAPAASPKRVAVVGGGMAGLVAARTLKLRGHEPVVFEATDRLGGQFVTAGMAPGKAEMAAAARSQGEQVERLGVEVRRRAPFTPETLAAEKFDELIVANGAEPVTLGLEGRAPVAVDVLEGRVQVPEGPVVVIGGGLVGLEVADQLATAGHPVTVVEMLEQAGADLGAARKSMVMMKMAQLGVDIRTGTRFVELADGGATVERDGARETLPGAVVVAVGSRPVDNAGLLEAARAAGVPVHVIGDAKSARRALDATREGFLVARDL
ncbi:bile acid Fe-S flavoenzyme BaiCD [Thermophilibacter mediterraneus]|uniref:bile acid Fe-S flavoenzyme BaiCD n=1 Tax=Thermophilibacter mediterraneus TaxID=1871031 RepID=UPI0009303BAA|nr:FAD-dependent oxidoreductase [Thermophilibacter mediterraneus]